MATETKTIIKQSFVPLPDEMEIILGGGKRADATSSFSGRVADFGIWRGSLGPQEIATLANCGEIVNKNLLVDLNQDWRSNQASHEFLLCSLNTRVNHQNHFCISGDSRGSSAFFSMRPKASIFHLRAWDFQRAS